MDIKKAEQLARERFGEGGLLCGESVLSTVAEQAGIDDPLIPRISTGFCGGLARTGGLCGAVAGGIMALGLAYGRDNAEQDREIAYKKVQQFMAAFDKEYHSTNCTQLTGCDLSTEAGRKAFKLKNAIEKCRDFTGTAARLAAELIRDGESDG